MKIGDKIIMQRDSIEHPAGSVGTVVEIVPHVNGLDYKVIFDRCDRKHASWCERKYCNGFPVTHSAPLGFWFLPYQDNQTAQNDNVCKCSIDMLMSVGCPSTKNKKCRSI